MMVHWIFGTALVAVISIIPGLIVGGLPPKHPRGFFKYLVSDRFGIPTTITFLILLGMASTGLGFGRIYVVTTSSNPAIYWSIGRPSYTFSGGHNATLQPHCVVNDTEQTLVLESVVYGNGFFRDDVLIKPGTAETFAGGIIHYFFEDVPPQKIEIKSRSTGGATQWWLRRKQ